MGVTHYFVTTRIDAYTSAIEIAEIKRLRLFDELGIPAVIVTLNHIRGSNPVLQPLVDGHKVINMFRYFQGVPKLAGPFPEITTVLKGMGNTVIQNGKAYRDGKLRVRVNETDGWLNNIDYLDQFGFTDRRDLYDFNQLVYSEYFDDQAKLITRVYYQRDGQVVMTEHFRGGPNNQPILTMIQLHHNGQEWQFDNQNELMAYFLDCLAMDDDGAIFYSDRENVAVPAFKLMTKPAKRYVILHSIFTQNAKRTGKLFSFVQQAIDLKGKLSGFIAATKQEACDMKACFPTVPTATIPVSYLDDELLKATPPFDNRIPGRVIAVARLTPLKRLTHIIRAVAKVHEHLPFVTLAIYGYGDAVNNFQEGNQLRWPTFLSVMLAKFIRFLCKRQLVISSIFKAWI